MFNKKDNKIEHTSVTLPKGGGNISGVGEKFEANAVTGTGNFSVPVAYSSSRFAPELSLSYDSGSGNSVFGMGWNINLNSISRKTAKGLPRYIDNPNVADSDTYIFSGMEDLVPVIETVNGNQQFKTRIIDNEEVLFLMPRTEGAFSRIQLHIKSSGDSYFKTITKNNITSIYGYENNSRIYDPTNPSKIFEWKLSKSYDDKGNVIEYIYKREDSVNIPNNSADYQRKNGTAPFTNLYIKQINYGNSMPYGDPAFGTHNVWYYTMVFDYGDHDINNPTVNPSQSWPVRQDPFSSFRSGFDIRTYRLCNRVLMFHNFGASEVVKSTELIHNPSQILTTVSKIVHKGWQKAGSVYKTKELPSVDFEYTTVEIDPNIKQLAGTEHLPNGISGGNSHWTDLNGEGISGVLTNYAGAWYYKENLGNGKLGIIKPVAKVPNYKEINLNDVDGDGIAELVVITPYLKGFYSKNSNGEWHSFTNFKAVPNINFDDPNLRMVDLTGDGRPDILITEGHIFRWYPNAGVSGYEASKFYRNSNDINKNPILVFNDPFQSVYLADMTGDGLTDIVRIENGRVSYWPNMGYGKFGNRVIMDNSPHFSNSIHLNHKYIKLADIDGSGTTDIFYFGNGKCEYWENRSGNSFGSKKMITPFLPVDALTEIHIVDLLGNGTSSLVWESQLPLYRGKIFYIDLHRGQKPHLLKTINNNMGKVVNLKYKSSIEYYLEDKVTGKKWITKLPFPVHTLESVETLDLIGKTSLKSSYRYRHGYYDGTEREFRGFGYTETKDVETVTGTGAGFIAPVITKNWYHLGQSEIDSIMDDTINLKFSQQYKNEYYQNTNQKLLEDTIIENFSTLNWQEKKEAFRGLKGRVLRSEVYSEGNDIPFTVTETNYRVKCLQKSYFNNGSKIVKNKHAVFLTVPGESVENYFEKMDIAPRIKHQFNLETDDFGNVTKSAELFYKRFGSGVLTEQSKPYLTAKRIDFTEYAENGLINYHSVPYLTEDFEIGYSTSDLTILSDKENIGFAVVKNIVNGALQSILKFDQEATYRTREARLLSKNSVYYWNDGVTAVAAAGNCGKHVLVHHIESSFMPDSMKDALVDLTDAEMSSKGGYYLAADNYWYNKGLIQNYYGADKFYLEKETEDPFRNKTTVEYDSYNMFPVKVTDAVGNIVTAEIDYRTLSPKKIIDMNDNVSEVLSDELGMVIVTSTYGTENGTAKGDLPISNYQISNITQQSIENIVSNPHTYLQDATTFFYYDLNSWKNRSEPLQALVLERETHKQDLTGTPTNVRIKIAYTDGFGRALQEKVSVESGLAWVKQANGTYIEQNSLTRYLVSGRKVYNNKQKPIKEYEPFYSGGYEYEDEEIFNSYGVTPIIHYDPLLRVIRTDKPYKKYGIYKPFFYSKVEFTPWEVKKYDENDTVLETEYFVNGNINPALNLSANEIGALNKAKALANLPQTVYLDSIGREFKSVNLLSLSKELVTFTTYDITGKPLIITDPRQYELNKTRAQNDKVVTFKYLYNMKGEPFYSVNIDSGTTVSMTNIFGKPMFVKDSKGTVIKSNYDALQRPLEVKLTTGGSEKLVEKFVYGETAANPKVKNLRGKIIEHYDQSGVSKFDSYSFKGELLKSTNQLRSDYKNEVNWSTSVALESEIFTSESKYNALGLIVEKTNPDSSVFKPAYHVSGRLNEVKVKLSGSSTFDSYVNSIVYNPKNQREKITYGNGTYTEYSYERETFRLTHLKTVRTSDNKALQDIYYHYDPIGNIVKKIDSSVQNLYFNNSVILPENSYTYDSLNRLIEANGREHIGQGLAPNFGSTDIPRVSLPHANSATALRNYTRTYSYDDNGNITCLSHSADGSTWNNNYSYDLLSNKLVSTQVGTGSSLAYTHDVNGNMTSLGDSKVYTFSYRNNIQSVNLGGGGTAYYVYDSTGNRVRKVIENTSNVKVKETLYIGGTEIFRQFSGSTVTSEIKTLHIMDDKQRIAMVEKRTVGTGTTAPLVRYQYADHLQSSSVEANNTGVVISFEEYYPFGGTSYHSVKSSTEISTKRYRFNGKEKDVETGLYYYGARYYAPWLARWTSCDPKGAEGSGLNMYWFDSDNPVNRIDLNGMEDFSALKEKFNVDTQNCGALNPDIRKDHIPTGERVSNFVENLKETIQNASPDEKKVMLASAVGAVGGTTPVVGDFVSVGASAYIFAKDTSWSSFFDLALDGVGAALPFIPAMGSIKRMKKLGEIADTAHDLEKMGGSLNENRKLFKSLDSDKLPNFIKDSFLDGKYETVETLEDMMVYRVYGGNAKLGGSFASNSKTADKIQAKLKNALLPEWKNTRNFEAEILVPKGTKLNIGVVAPQTIKSTGTVLPGGNMQILLPQNWSEQWVKEVRKVNS